MAKKKQPVEVVEQENEEIREEDSAKEKFEERLHALQALAKKKKNVLEYQEVVDYFADLSLDEDGFRQGARIPRCEFRGCHPHGG